MATSKREEDFLKLKNQYEAFRMKKMEVGMRLEQARKNLDKLEKEALTVFGTTDITVIESNLAAMQEKFDADMASAVLAMTTADTALTELDAQLKSLPDIDA